MRDFHPHNCNGAIRLQFSVDGVRFSFFPLPGGRWESKDDRKQAEAIATRIKLDIKAGYFDPTLERYKHKASQVPIKAKSKSLSTLEIWDKWVESLSLPSHTKADHYDVVRKQIINSELPAVTDTYWFESNQKLSPSTWNRRLKYLRSCFNWAVEEGLATLNPWLKVKERKTKKKEIRPFTIAEIQLILEEIERSHPSYRPFVEFLFLSGVRTGEAVGLRWRDVDLGKGILTIRESVGRSREGNRYQKIRKSTKTENVRSLQMSNRLKTLLTAIRELRPDEPADNLIFLSPKARTIDHGNFRNQCWKPTLEKLGLPYRKPYTTRHTLLSHALESGLSVLQVAQLAGHSDGRMVLQNYGHVINQPKLPEL